MITFSDRPGRISSDVRVDLPYPRHRDDPRIVEPRTDPMEQLDVVR